jgi:quinol monooxygenase YgiN
MSSVPTNSKASQRTGDEITNAVLVRYRVKPNHVERNRELARGFLRGLSAAQLANRYAVFTLADDVSFVHLHLFADEAEEKQFTQLPSFSTFEKDLAERREEPPAVTSPRRSARTAGSTRYDTSRSTRPDETIGDRT